MQFFVYFKKKKETKLTMSAEFFIQDIIRDKFLNTFTSCICIKSNKTAEARVMRIVQQCPVGCKFSMENLVKKKKTKSH